MSEKSSHSKATDFFKFCLSLKMSKKCNKDYFNFPQLGNHGPDHADDNPRKLEQTIRCTCGTVSTRTLQEIYY